MQFRWIPYVDTTARFRDRHPWGATGGSEMSEAMPQSVDSQPRRADILRLKFRGKGHYWCTIRRWPRWTIDDMAFLLSSLAQLAMRPSLVVLLPIVFNDHPGFG